jgi:hypothetical protein
MSIMRLGSCMGILLHSGVTGGLEQRMHDAGRTPVCPAFFAIAGAGRRRDKWREA